MFFIFYKFSDEVHDYQKFVSNNIKYLGNFKLLDQQLMIKDQNTSFIDILVYDNVEKRLVILELKNVKAKDAIIGQIIKYYDYILRAQKEIANKYSLEIEQDPKILLIVPDFNANITNLLNYIKLDVQLVKLNIKINFNSHEIIKEVYNKSKVDLSITLGDSKKNIYKIDDYLKNGINENKLNIIKDFILYMELLLPGLKIFYYEQKIVLMLENKIITNIIINRKLFDNYLVIVLDNKNINIQKVMYDINIMKYNTTKNKIKLTCVNIPRDLLKEIFT